jgi:hypothetical protein
MDVDFGGAIQSCFAPSPSAPLGSVRVLLDLNDLILMWAPHRYLGRVAGLHKREHVHFLLGTHLREVPYVLQLVEIPSI